MPDGDHSYELVEASLLEKIDKLFACNAGDYIDLPQLVVVGQQSSGKSSVLVGLTGLPFPRDSGLCTRFATQITFRRANVESINISIIPAKESSTEHQASTRSWNKDVEKLDADAFAKIMIEVSEAMGSDRACAFSKDVLVIEIAGPKQEHFSIIDVPGTFKRTTAGVTSKADMTMVDAMVHGYMQNPRSVMLAAEDVDPEGDRTFGILTKPDLVDTGAEKSVIDLIEGRSHKLKLGWHLLRNPGQSEIGDDSKPRNTLEEVFFNTQAPWSAIDKDKVGVESLRVRLQEILAGHLRREFPKVKADIIYRLKKATLSYNILGTSRQTQADQRQFLIEVATRFQEIAAAASRADYSNSELFGKSEKVRLATVSVNRGQEFADNMAKFGHLIEFATEVPADEIGELDLGDLTKTGSEDLGAEDSGSEDSVGPKPEPTARTVVTHADLEDLVMEDVDIELPNKNGIFGWLKSLHRQSRGFEMGTFDHSIIAVAMRNQAEKWNDLATGYISDIIDSVHTFVTELLQYLVSDCRVRDSILSLLIDQLRARYEAALKHTEFLLNVELGGVPATYNHYFKETLEKRRQERLQSQMSKKSIDVDGCGHVVRIGDIVQSHPMSNDNHIVIEIHEILHAYYNLARKRFIDNVRMQVADHFLVTGPGTPTKIFSPTFVASMTEEQLEEVAGEEAGLKRRREALRKEIKRLEEAKRILR